MLPSIEINLCIRIIHFISYASRNFQSLIWGYLQRKVTFGQEGGQLGKTISRV